MAVTCLLLASAVLVPRPGAQAQDASRVRRIGMLRITPDLAWMEAFRQGLSDLGWVEGQQIAIIDRLAEELPDPEGPSSVRNSPARAVSVTPSTARVAPKLLTRPS